MSELKQEIRFCTTSDGVRIAYATMGEGSPSLVSVPTWISPFKYAEYEPALAAFYRRLASHFQVVQFDGRGTGMSDRDVHDFSRSDLVKDLEAVIDRLGLRRVALCAWQLSGFTAIEYAHRHPDMVSHLVLVSSLARGRNLRGGDTDALIQLVRSGWEVAPEMIAALNFPGAQPEISRAYFTALRESCSGESAAAQLEAALEEDVMDLLHEIKTPTLVLHARQSRTVPFELGRELASRLPNARLLPFEWNPANLAVAKAIEEFLAPAGAGQRRPVGKAGPSAFATILFTDVEGSTALTDRLGDAKARELLREHEHMVREALNDHGGSEVKALGDGFMASFSSATRALECAIAIQRALAERNESAEEPILVRVGLNAGEPIAEDEDLFGASVNRAARIAAMAEGGEILAANVVRELAEGKGFLFGDRGETALRGFDDPVRLFEVRWRDG